MHVCILFIYLYIYIHKIIIDSAPTLCKHQLLFWMRLIVINHLTALIKTILKANLHKIKAFSCLNPTTVDSVQR